MNGGGNGGNMKVALVFITVLLTVLMGVNVRLTSWALDNIVELREEVAREVARVENLAYRIDTHTHQGRDASQ